MYRYCPHVKNEVPTPETLTPKTSSNMKNNLMQFFEYTHLPEHLQSVSKPFGELAAKIEADIPGNAEKTVALRKLLEAKDCAVRALLFKEAV